MKQDVTDAKFTDKRWADPGEWPPKPPPLIRNAKFRTITRAPKPPKVKDPRPWWKDRHLVIDWRWALVASILPAMAALRACSG